MRTSAVRALSSRTTKVQQVTRSIHARTFTTTAAAGSSALPAALSNNHEAVAATLASHSKYVLNTYARPSFILSHGKGMYLFDTESRKYLDFTAGIAVNALGHADAQVAEIVADQSNTLIHCSNLLHHFWSGEAARILVEATKKHGGLGFDGQDGSPSTGSITQPAEEAATSGLKVFFANSGTEANEGALKFARKYGKQVSSDPSNTSKVEIVSYNDGFHGRSMGSLSATWQEKYQAPFAPLLPGFKQGTYNDLASIEREITEDTCGVLLEPIQGEGGIMEAKEEWLRAVRKRCDEVNAVLIYDEIQCGLSRTGSLWAHAHFPKDCHPDLVTVAKPLANGLPIGGILMKDKIADVIKLGDHGTTFGGAPLQTRVACHVVERLTEPSFLTHVSSVSEHLKSRLVGLAEKYPSLVPSAVRGRGLILGLPLADAALPGKVAEMCRERGVLLLTCGRNTLRFVPSLIVTKDEVDLAVDVLDGVLADLA